MSDTETTSTGIKLSTRVMRRLDKLAHWDKRNRSAQIEWLTDQEYGRRVAQRRAEREARQTESPSPATQA